MVKWLFETRKLLVVLMHCLAVSSRMGSQRLVLELIKYLTKRRCCSLIVPGLLFELELNWNALYHFLTSWLQSVLKCRFKTVTCFEIKMELYNNNFLQKCKTYLLNESYFYRFKIHRIVFPQPLHMKLIFSDGNILKSGLLYFRTGTVLKLGPASLKTNWDRNHKNRTFFGKIGPFFEK